MTRLLPLAAALAGLLAFTGPDARAQCTTSWTNPAGGAWTTASNWSAGVPDASDVACITLAGTYTATVAGFTVNGLVLGGASGTQTLTNSGEFTLGVSGVVNPNGVFQWTAGYLNSGTLINNGLVRLTGSSTSRGVRGATALFRNTAAVEHADAGRFYTYNGARTENASLWEITSEGDLYGTTSAGVFENEDGATLRKSGGTGTASVTGSPLVFENAGTINVQAGTVEFDVPSAHTAVTLTASAGATLNFSSGGVTFSGTISGNPAGLVTINDAITASPSATWDFGGSGIEWTDGYLESGTLLNAGLVRLTGGSTSRGARGATARFRNESTVEHADTGRFYTYNSARTENAGLWDVTSEGDLYGTTSAGTFENEAGATLRKSGGTGVTTFVTGSPLVFENAGTINVQSGTVQFDIPSSHANGVVLTTGAGATLRFNSGGVTFTGAISGTQAGTLTLDDAVNAPSGAAWAFGGTGMTWTDGYLESGTLRNTGLVRLTGGSTSRGVRGATARFRNESTVEHADTGRFYTYNDARTENASLWEITNEGDLYGTSTAGTFENEAGATLRKSGGSAATTFITGAPLVFENAGTINVQAGTVEFGIPSTHTAATLTTGAGATLRFNSGGVTFVGTISGTQVGTLTLDDFVTAGAGARWDFGGTGMTWTDGYLESGTLRNTGLVRLTGGSTSRGVRGATAVFRNEDTMEHADAGRFYTYNGARTENADLWDITGDGDLYGTTSAGTFENEAGATLRKSGAGTTFVTGSPLVFENAGTVSVQSGEIDVDVPFDHQAGALIQGAAIFDKTNASPFTHSGDTGPGFGNQTGILTWEGPFAPSAASTLLVDLGGLAPGAGHDQLAVVGDATLDGTLRLDIAVGSAPAIGDTFTVLTTTGSGNNVSGTFDAVEVPFGYTFDVEYTATSVVVTVLTVPNFDLLATNTSSLTVEAGGSVSFAYSVTNNTTAPITGDLFFTANPGGFAGIIRSGTLPAGATVSGTYTQGVPSFAPPGAYTYTIRIGEFPSTTVDQVAFTLTVVPALREASGAEAWAVGEASGWGESPAAGAVAEASSPEASVTMELPAEFALHAAYPNPFASSATLRYDLPQASAVRLAVYDLLGREVARPVDGRVEAGSHTAVLAGSQLAAGIYVVRLTAGEQVFTQRVTLTR